MARACVHISVILKDGLEHHVRTYGGNKSDVRQLYYKYSTMTKSEFLNKHPYFTDKCGDNFVIHVFRTK